MAVCPFEPIIAKEREGRKREGSNSCPEGNHGKLERSVSAAVMATSGYVEDLQQPSQPQGGSVTMAPGQHPAPPPAPPSAPPQFLVELQTNAAAATPSHYVTAEIQSVAAQPSNGQSTPQYIVVTVTEGSLHSNDSVSDSSPPGLGFRRGSPLR
ncbi:hypothetical protein ANANG_G00033580 [Anguilla anguilla]|uniref:Uncharacterized protein n=1 Tax=Anguilla anguilla TaxID=7936 RepID=A0A9D3S8Q7_ANGAN|nr:hypothetical protein ANANG_G00033580 [Anguilla anguilla]